VSGKDQPSTPPPVGAGSEEAAAESAGRATDNVMFQLREERAYQLAKLRDEIRPDGSTLVREQQPHRPLEPVPCPQCLAESASRSAWSSAQLAQYQEARLLPVTATDGSTSWRCSRDECGTVIGAGHPPQSRLPATDYRRLAAELAALQCPVKAHVSGCKCAVADALQERDYMRDAAVAKSQPGGAREHELQEALDSAEREIERLTDERDELGISAEMACENSCGDCAGCNRAHELQGVAAE